MNIGVQDLREENIFKHRAGKIQILKFDQIERFIKIFALDV